MENRNNKEPRTLKNALQNLAWELGVSLKLEVGTTTLTFLKIFFFEHYPCHKMAPFFASSFGKHKHQTMLTASRRSSTRKYISFAGNTQICETLHIDEYSTEEVQATWYSKSELQDIKNAIRDVVIRNVSNDKNSIIPRRGSGDDKEEESCKRGFEGFSKHGAAQKRKNKMDAAMALFSEQECQKDYGIVDDEALALLYGSCTRHCQAVAHARALQDELVALAVYAPPAPLLLSSSSSSSPLLQQFKSSTSRMAVLAGQQQRVKLLNKAAQAA
jgi:hypothetical protein